MRRLIFLHIRYHTVGLGIGPSWGCRRKDDSDGVDDFCWAAGSSCVPCVVVVMRLLLGRLIYGKDPYCVYLPPVFRQWRACSHDSQIGWSLSTQIVLIVRDLHISARQWATHGPRRFDEGNIQVEFRANQLIAHSPSIILQGVERGE